MSDMTPALSAPKCQCLSDLDRSGSFAPRLLLADDSRVVVQDAQGIEVEFPLQNLEKVSSEELPSGIEIFAVVKGQGRVRLLTGTSERAAELTAMARVLQNRIENGTWVTPESLELWRCPTCQGPLDERGAPCRHCVQRTATLRRLIGMLGPYKKFVILMIVLTTLSVGMQMLPTYMGKLIVDRVLEMGHKEELFLLVGVMLGALVFEHSLRAASNLVNAWLACRVTADLRGKLHASMQRLPMAYHTRHESGELIGRVTHDTDHLHQFLVDGLPYVLVNIFSFIAIACILLAIDWQMALMVFFPAPLLILGGRYFWGRLVPLFNREGNRTDRLHSILGESVRAVRTVKATGQEDRRHAEFSGSNENLRGVRFQVERTWTCFAEAMNFAMGLGVVLVWTWGAQRILGKQLSMGDLIAFIGYGALFYGPLQWFTAVFNWMTNAMTSAERIFRILDTPAEVDAAPGSHRVQRVKGEIRFEQVHFAYDRGKEIIRGIDLTIKSGSMIGLVGKSGAGKSTIINLICRFYAPDSGRITVDGINLQDYALADWRRQLGIVLQEPFLFHSSILDNIRAVKPDASLEQVIAAARAACAHEFIVQKPDGYDTVVGEGGVDLSGGERQRIAIARAILADPPILILDEATAAIDTETERDIQAAIGRLVAGRTTIAIAHRLATLRNADQLVVIDDGRVVESGSHDDLLSRPEGRFRRLVEMQREVNRMRGEQAVIDG